MLETYRECLRDVFDVPGLKQVLADIERQQIRVHPVETSGPSPFAGALLFNYTANFLYQGDAPLAERRAAALAGIIASGQRFGNVALLLIGVWLFADCRGWLGDNAWALLGGLLLIFVGVRAITGRPGRLDRHERRRMRRFHDGPEAGGDSSSDGSLPK